MLKAIQRRSGLLNLAKLTALLSLLSACSQVSSEQCAPAWDRYSMLEIDFSKLQRTRFPVIDIGLISNIYHCYESHPYISSNYDLLLTDEWLSDTSQRKYLVFTIEGVSETDFVVVTDDQDRILDVGTIRKTDHMMPLEP